MYIEPEVFVKDEFLQALLQNAPQQDLMRLRQRLDEEIHQLESPRAREDLGTNLNQFINVKKRSQEVRYQCGRT